MQTNDPLESTRARNERTIKALQLQLINAYESITRRHHQLQALEKRAKGLTTKLKDTAHSVGIDGISPLFRVANGETRETTRENVIPIGIMSRMLQFNDMLLSANSHVNGRDLFPQLTRRLLDLVIIAIRIFKKPQHR